MKLEQKALVYLRCFEQRFIRHSKTDTSNLSKRLLKTTREKIQEIENTLGINKFQEVLNAENTRH